MENPCSGSGAGVYTLYHGDLRGVAHPQGDDRAADAVGGNARAPVDAGDSRAGDQTDCEQPAPERLRSGADGRKTVVLRTALIVIALAMIAAGIVNGGMDDVLAKGSAICTECVGIG